jgi:hypothetical protein
LPARFVIAISVAVFGVDHFLDPSFAPGLPQEGPVIITMPAWIPGHVFRAYLTGAIFIDCTLGLLSRRYARSGNHRAGPDPVCLPPTTIAKASEIVTGLNCLAIHFALAGPAFFLAEAMPATVSDTVSVPEIQRSSVRQV